MFTWPGFVVKEMEVLNYKNHNENGNEFPQNHQLRTQEECFVIQSIVVESQL